MASAVRRLGRYALHRQIAAGGMASVHLGRLVGPAGFSRTVAIKRLHPQLAQDASFVAMFLDEARVTGRIVHPNIVSTMDVVQERGELFIVMDFVQGAALSTLFVEAQERGEPIPPAIAVGIVANALAGLHAAHEALGEGRVPLQVVHRDVSPHNILVGTDGIARIADFGIAKAVGRMQSTTQGQLKGKLSYMAPEVIRGEPVDRRVDLYGAAVVLWELLTGERLFQGNEASILYDALEAEVDPPSQRRPDLPAGLDAVVLKGLAKDREARFATAAEFADALEQVLSPASARRIGAWVESLAREDLTARAALIEELEKSDDAPPVSEARVPDKPVAGLASSSLVDDASSGGSGGGVSQGISSPTSTALPDTEGELTPPPALRAPSRPAPLSRRVAVPLAGLLLGCGAAVLAFRGGATPASAPDPIASASSPAPEAPTRVAAPPAAAAPSEAIAASAAVPPTASAAPSAPPSAAPPRAPIPARVSPGPTAPAAATATPAAPTSAAPTAPPLPVPEKPVL